MKIGTALRRTLLPGFVVQILYWMRCGAMVSARSEVEFSPSARLGRGTVISAFTKVKVGGPFVTGLRTQIASHCFLSSGAGGVTLGDDVLIGPGCVIVGNNYRYEKLGVPLPDQGTESRGIRIHDRVWLGAQCVVLDGVTMGADAIAVAGSIVTSDVPEGAVVEGNPARVIFTRR
ncbi:MAG: acyltransferase [Gemmatimonadota bacterium]|nr:transferase [Gemmatimonadota bacterium]MDP6461125.1 acyltransferase [Gemmatimonadota bacterium]MDP6529819.1 acyltransferase [Gemmatimonadota bacterium]MDP6802762.1 acyltransferase [Gemmatimonadota bacterium]MDP7032114.1 acyltransferase [Gemmatimonadota bacterium]